MKLAIHLFTFYMLTLSFIPCGDGGGGILEIANHLFGVEHQHVADHEQHSNSCGDDDCTPFCICNCCSTTLDTPAKIALQVDLPTAIPGTSPSFVPNFILSGHNPPIWQPPKFS